MYCFTHSSQIFFSVRVASSGGSSGTTIVGIISVSKAHLHVFTICVHSSDVLTYLPGSLCELIHCFSWIGRTVVVHLSRELLAPPFKLDGPNLLLLLSAMHSVTSVSLCWVGATCACWCSITQLLRQWIQSPSRIRRHLFFLKTVGATVLSRPMEPHRLPMDGLQREQMQSKHTDRLESLKKVSIQLTLSSYSTLSLAICSAICSLLSDLIDLVCPLLHVAGSFPYDTV